MEYTWLVYEQNGETETFDSYEKALEWYEEVKEQAKEQEADRDGAVDTNFYVCIAKIERYAEYKEDPSDPVYVVNDEDEVTDIETGDYYWKMVEKVIKHTD